MNLIIGLGLFLAVMLGLRFLASHVRRPVPEIALESRVPADTRLQHILDTWKVHHKADQRSLCYPLGDAREALLSRLGLADMADVSIDAQYYVFHDDESGRGLLAALVEAARRGVRVRLLLDDIDLKGRDAYLSRLAREVENLEIRVFNPLWIRIARPLDFIVRFPRSSRRMHNKSFTVDSAACIVGGRNIGDEYFAADAQVSFTDYDMLAAGTVAEEVVSQFDEYWYGGLSVNCTEIARPAKDQPYHDWYQQLMQAGQRLKLDREAEQALPSDQLHRLQLDACPCKTRLLFDPPEKVLSRLFDTDGSLAPQIMDLMLSARESLLISSPYFIPGASGMELFRQLRERGVEISVLTNSFAANDVLAVHAGYIDYREQMVALGVRMYEFKPDNDKRHLRLLGAKRSSLHAKTFIIDSQRLFVGSFNLDPRSAIHNTEMGIVFDNAELSASLNRSLTGRLEEIAYHLKLSEQGQLQWEEQTDQGNCRVHHSEPHTVAWQRFGVYLMSWLPVEWLL